MTTIPLFYLFSGTARFYRGEHSTNANDYNAWYFESGYYYVEYSQFIGVDSVSYGRWQKKDGRIQVTALYPDCGRQQILCRPPLDEVITDPNGHAQYEFRYAHPADTALVDICTAQTSDSIKVKYPSE